MDRHSRFKTYSSPTRAALLDDMLDFRAVVRVGPQLMDNAYVCSQQRKKGSLLCLTCDVM